MGRFGIPREEEHGEAVELVVFRQAIDSASYVAHGNLVPALLLKILYEFSENLKLQIRQNGPQSRCPPCQT
ncbi:hypothetical protein L596_024946 [Steinernema carpocapsae]|uniref:Uncharacterized protein n=1 Tax=Steinernema carpocapsae TaxID=34508 RepID=A0A4U5M6C1_STECR|nr:hypothetical protein L596_024946 [Steinernema carpocapsae]